MATVEIYCVLSSPAGAVVTSLSDQPILKDIVCHAVPRIAPKWYDLGLALDVEPFVLNDVSHQQEKADRPREMFAKWLEGSPGTGSQPRTWQTILDAVGMICGSAPVEDIHTAVKRPRIPTAGKSRTSFPVIQADVLVNMHEFQYNHSFLCVLTP